MGAGKENTAAAARAAGRDGAGDGARVVTKQRSSRWPSVSFRRGRGRGRVPAPDSAAPARQQTVAAGCGAGAEAVTGAEAPAQPGAMQIVVLRPPTESTLILKRGSRQYAAADGADVAVAAGPAVGSSAGLPATSAGDSPGATALPTLKLGNPRASSLHRRRSLKLAGSKRHSAEVPLRTRPASLNTASSLLSPTPLATGGGERQWSPSVCLSLNLTPVEVPPSPIVWGFDGASSPLVPSAPAGRTHSPAVDSLHGFGPMEDMWSPSGGAAIAASG